jgi:glycosyltransferase involved in cell wall biosynthesis
MSSKAILVVANRLPFPVDDGWKRRTYHVLRALARCGPVTLVAFHAGEDAAVRALRESLEGALDVIPVPRPGSAVRMAAPLGFVTRTPYLFWRVRSRRFRAQVRRLGRERRFAIAVAELASMFPYLRELPTECARIVDTHNVDSTVVARYADHMRGRARRWYARQTARKLRAVESRIFAEADAVWVCSAVDARHVTRVVPQSRVHVVPNGVDSESFRATPGARPAPNRILFFGRLDYHPNRDAVRHLARDVLPVLKRMVPGIEARVVGPGASRELRALSARDPALRIVGPVPDLRSELEQAGAVVVPLRSGGGTRLKILEALALERPVVTTSVGTEGLDLEHGRELLVADDARTFAECVRDVLSDPVLAGRLGRAGRAAVVATYDWVAIEKTITDLVADTRAHASISA